MPDLDLATLTEDELNDVYEDMSPDDLPGLDQRDRGGMSVGGQGDAQGRACSVWRDGGSDEQGHQSLS